MVVEKALDQMMCSRHFLSQNSCCCIGGTSSTYIKTTYHLVSTDDQALFGNVYTLCIVDRWYVCLKSYIPLQVMGTQGLVSSSLIILCSWYFFSYSFS